MTDVKGAPVRIESESDAAAPFRKILVGTDGSTGAARAMEWAAHVAQAWGSSVTVVHILTPNQEFVRDFSFETMHLWRRDLESELRGPWVQPLRARNVKPRCLLIEADSVAAGLMKTAVETDADLVVVSTRGRGRSATSHLLAERSQRPVVVVPTTWEPAPPSAATSSSGDRVRVADRRATQ